MTSKVSDLEISAEVHGFAMRALRDFELLEAFMARPVRERETCLDWLVRSPSEQEQERRVSRMLDDLYRDRPLSGASHHKWTE